MRQLIDSKQYNDAAIQLLDIMTFACTNVITFRQLLIRYDAFCRAFDGMPLNEWHLQRSVLDVNHPVHGLFEMEGVDELEKRVVMGLQQEQQTDQRQSAGQTGELGGKAEKNRCMSPEEFTNQVQSFAYLLNKTDTLLGKAVSGHLVAKDRLLVSTWRMKQYLLFGLRGREFLSSDIFYLRCLKLMIKHQLHCDLSTNRWSNIRIDTHERPPLQT